MDGRDAAEDELIARLIDARPAIKQRWKIDAKLIDDIIDSTTTTVPRGGGGGGMTAACDTSVTKWALPCDSRTSTRRVRRTFARTPDICRRTSSRPWRPIHTARQTRQDSVVRRAVWIESARQVRSASECVRRSHRQCMCRPTHSVAERTCRAVGPTQFTPPHQTRQDGPVCVVSGEPRAVWIGRRGRTIALSVFRFQNSLELSGIQFTPPKWTRQRQDSFIVSGVAVWIYCRLNYLNPIQKNLIVT